MREGNLWAYPSEFCILISSYCFSFSFLRGLKREKGHFYCVALLFLSVLCPLSRAISNLVDFSRAEIVCFPSVPINMKWAWKERRAKAVPLGRYIPDSIYSSGPPSPSLRRATSYFPLGSGGDKNGLFVLYLLYKQSRNTRPVLTNNEI